MVPTTMTRAQACAAEPQSYTSHLARRESHLRVRAVFTRVGSEAAVVRGPCCSAILGGRESIRGDLCHRSRIFCTLCANEPIREVLRSAHPAIEQAKNWFDWASWLSTGLEGAKQESSRGSARGCFHLAPACRLHRPLAREVEDEVAQGQCSRASSTTCSQPARSRARIPRPSLGGSTVCTRAAIPRGWCRSEGPPRPGSGSAAWL